MNYIATARTNYFHVTDKEKFDQLMAGLCAEDVNIVTDDVDNTMYAVLFDGSASYYKPASACKDFMEEIKGKKIFDSDYNEISIENIDNYREIYGEDGDLIFDRFDDDDNFDEFLEEIVKIIPEDECFVYIESGYEGHRYVVGYAVVATKKGIKHMNLDTFIDNSVKELLGENAKTKYTY